MRIFGEFTKVEKQDDGTLIVTGTASSEAVDCDGEVITADAMRAAIPDYMKFGAIREMHAKSAAGTAIEAVVNEDGVTLVKALVVDPLAITKVEKGVYKGFSIGGKVTERDSENSKIIKGLRLAEISLVDRPANPEAVFDVYKADGDGTVEKSLYDVSTFASTLQSIAWLAMDAESEAVWEGDSSPIPGRLRDWLKSGAEILADMTKEELDELVARAQPAAKAAAAETTKAETTKAAVAAPSPAETSVKTEKTETPAAATPIEKTVAKAKPDHSKLLQIAHDAISGLGATCSAEKVETILGELAKLEPIAEVAKVEAPTGDDAVAKLASELSALRDTITKVSSENAELKQQVAKLSAEPAPAKGAVRGVAITKQNDVIDTKSSTTPDVQKTGDAAVLDLIKAAHATGGVSLRG